MAAEDRRADALRVLGWIVGVLGALLGVLGLLLAVDGGYASIVSAVGVVGGSGVCALCAIILDHRPSNRAAWALMAGGLLLVATSLCYGWAITQARAGTATPAVLALAVAVDALAGESLPLFLFLFPTGRLPSPRWRPAFAVYVLGWLAGPATLAAMVWPSRDPAVAEYAGGLTDELPGSLTQAATVNAGVDLFGVVFLLAGIAAVVMRLRHARGVERIQLLWAAWGLGVTVALVVSASFASSGVKTALAVAAPVPFYVAITVAMRRHQLFDVQRLIRRTVTYTAITALLLGLYAAVAVGLGALVGGFGIGSSVAVAAATLAVAMAFRPALRLVRGVVDRRFDRRTWLAVRAIDEFTERLRAGTATPGDMLTALRQALDDDTATVTYVDGATLIDLDGAPAQPGERRAGRLRRQVTAGGSLVAQVELDARLADEPRLVDAALDAAALPLENAALHARAAVRLAEVQASRSRIVAAEDTQRRRIERDLHDGAQQRLVALALRLRIAERDLTPANRRAAQVLATAVDELRATVDELRELTRGLLPPALTDEGLAVALRAAAARLPIPVTIDIGPGRLPPTLEATCWFVANEAMTNAIKHAGASALRITLERGKDTVALEVRDDGAGGATITPAGGLQGLADRVAAVGGHLHVLNPPGGGTTIRAELPCAS